MLWRNTASIMKGLVLIASKIIAKVKTTNIHKQTKNKIIYCTKHYTRPLISKSNCVTINHVVCIVLAGLANYASV